MAEIWSIWSIRTKNEILKNVLKVFEETLKILKIKKCLYTVNGIHIMVSAPWTNFVHIKQVKQWLELGHFTIIFDVDRSNWLTFHYIICTCSLVQMDKVL